ncbi:MAG TPA: OmpA family protein, partial [Kiloniellales bacterium]|nr:OmpA family protein [Kiloniellales bacterium]
PTPAPAPQTAALPPPGDMQVLFEPESVELSAAAMDQLATLADMLKADESLRVQLLAYANSPDGSNSAARRLSLSRALAVRAYLIDAGIRTARFIVRAQGADTSGGPPDRVDVVLVTQ